MKLSQKATPVEWLTGLWTSVYDPSSSSEDKTIKSDGLVRRCRPDLPWR